MSIYQFDGHKLAYHPDRVSQFLRTGDCFPLYMEISPVGMCNHRCIFCAYDFIGHPNRKLETVRTLAFIDELAEAGLKSVLFAGEGEPLLHPDLELFIQKARSNCIDVGLFTNGQLLTVERAAAIMKDLTFIRFSFNGGNKDSYARVHNVKPGVFDDVVASVKNAVVVKKRSGLSTTVGAQFVLLPENIDSMYEAAIILREIGIDYLVIKPFVHQSPQQGYRMEHPMDAERLHADFTLMETLNTNDFRVIVRKAMFSDSGVRHYSRCFGTAFISVLNSAGDIAGCLPHWDKRDFVFGNFYDHSFFDIWNGPRRKIIKTFLEEKLDVMDCPLNCRPSAINEFLFELKYPSVEHVNFI